MAKEQNSLITITIQICYEFFEKIGGNFEVLTNYFQKVQFLFITIQIFQGVFNSEEVFIGIYQFAVSGYFYEFITNRIIEKLVIDNLIYYIIRGETHFGFEFILIDAKHFI
jgi:hypothetical protein